jgi:hypothetical protein
MSRFKLVAVIATLGIFLSVITGAALAGNGNGNGNGGNSAAAPGHQKAAPAAQPAAPTAAPKPAKTTKSSHAGAQQTANAQPSTPGMKPANNTAKGTHCSTGGSPGAATCTSSGSNTAAATAKSDSSKRYGNGQTAAQIAVGRGAPAGTDIYGPGNSQPHKVTDCKHKHGVDVHAVKNYSSSACTASTPSPTQSQTQKVETNCAGTTVQTNSAVSSVKMQRGHAYGRLKHGKGLHSKSTIATQNSSTFTPSGANCGGNSSSNTSTNTNTASNSNTTSNTNTSSNAATAAGTKAAAGNQTGNGVLGAKASKASGRTLAAGVSRSSKSGGGVLGATGRAAGALGAAAHRGSLPFTGFPIWAALLIGLGLVAAGIALRHRGRRIGRTIV